MRKIISLTPASRFFASTALTATGKKLPRTLPAAFLAAAMAATPLHAVGTPPVEWQAPHHPSAVVPFPVAYLSDNLLTPAGDLPPFFDGADATRKVHVPALFSSAAPPCMPSALATSLNGEHSSADNSFSCRGDNVTVDVGNSEGVTTIKTCVTNGTCEGSWDGFDISVTVDGTSCFTVTID